MQKLGSVYAALGLDHIALRYFQKAVDLASSDMEAQFALIRHLIRLRHYKEADTHVKTAKDIYYHHKSSLAPHVLEEIKKLETQVRSSLHKKK